ncbi:hypothetical protein ScPMuIL_004067, partial [Solemya velum]
GNKGEPRGLSPCQKWWKCPNCYKVVNRKIRKTEDHQCGEFFVSLVKITSRKDTFVTLELNRLKIWTCPSSFFLFRVLPGRNVR